MWFLGAVLGAVLAAQVHSELWIVGALLGGLSGWSVGSRARHRAEERFRVIDERLQRLEATLQRLEQAAPASAAASSAGTGAAIARDARPRAAAVPAVSVTLPEVDAAAVDAATKVLPEATAPMTPQSPSPSHVRQEPAPPRQEVSPVWERLLRGNPVARVGVVILFFGVAFLLKYTYQHVQVPIELRLTAVALLAVVLLAIGWRLRVSREAYALVLQGGGVGVLYLTIFGALRLFGVLAAGPAFVLLLAVVALSAALAVLQDSLALAMLGAAGGFLAPILASSGGGSHVALFCYYAVLDAGILVIAWFQAWRLLNLLGFAFTFAIATFWGVLDYRPEQYASSQFFLILFFLMYVAIPVLFLRREAGRFERRLDGTLVFGVPLISFGLQVGLVHEFPYGSAWSALALGAFYLLLARTLWARRSAAQPLLVEAFLALGVVFTTLVIPLAFDGRWTSAAWALEGAAMVWVGARQRRLPARLFGTLLQFAAGFFFSQDAVVPAGEWPLLNSGCLGSVLLAVAGLSSAWLLESRRDDLLRRERCLIGLLFGWGVAWWVGAGLHEIDRWLPYAWQSNATLGFCTISCLAFAALERRLRWRLARYPAFALLPSMILLALTMVFQTAHPFAYLGYVAWPLAFAAQLFLLYRHEAAGQAWLEWQHAAALWLLAAVGAWEMAWTIDRLVAGRAVWALIAWPLVPGALLLLLAWRGERLRWPTGAHLATYLVKGGTPLILFVAAWFVVSNLLSDGDPGPLPYVPLLNPLDLAQAGVLLVAGTWYWEVRRLALRPVAALPPSLAWTVAAAAAFLWANGILLRSLHHWGGVPWQLAAIVRSDLVQAALSLFWTLLALATMVLATRRAQRVPWLAGAGLMAVVVGKLFLVDLSNAGTIERIVSFVGVGVLMLVIGYLAPAPPKGGSS